MLVRSGGNLHDSAHFWKVYALAKTIGEQEGLDEETQTVLEAAAVLHDISCPLCRERYQTADGKRQEQEGAPLSRPTSAALFDQIYFARRLSAPAWRGKEERTLLSEEIFPERGSRAQ